jgi:hypothetical protein
MGKDGVVEQVREARQEYAKRFDYDVDRIYRDLKKKEAKGGKSTVSLPPKRVKSPTRKGKSRVSAQYDRVGSTHHPR